MTENVPICVFDVSDAMEFRNLIRSLGNVLFKPEIQIDSTGLRIFQMDSTHVSMLDLTWKPEGYSFLREQATELWIRLPCDWLLKLLRVAKRKQRITISIFHNEKKVDTMRLRFHGKVRRQITFALELSERPEETRKPKIQMMAEVDVQATDILEILRSPTYDEYVTITATPTQIALTGKIEYAEEEAVIESPPKFLNENIQETKVSFSQGFLAAYCQLLSYVSPTIKMSLGTNLPIKIEAHNDQMNATTWIAPRIPDTT